MNYQQFCQQYKPTEDQLFSDFYDVFQDQIGIKNKKIAVKKLKNIILATFKLSATQSFANMSLRQLAKETKMSMGGLYAYIQNKQQLSLYIHQFLNHFVEKTLNQTEQDLDNLIKTHVYLSEILQPWFFFAFMESKNLNKDMKKFAIKSELLMESRLVKAIKQGQYNSILTAETLATHIKPLLHDWYLKRWKYHQRKITVDDFCQSILTFIKQGLASETKVPRPKPTESRLQPQNNLSESGLQSRQSSTNTHNLQQQPQPPSQTRLKSRVQKNINGIGTSVPPSQKKYKHLHHVDLADYHQFITFRTNDSLDSFLEKLNKQNKPNDKKQIEIDQYLDQSNKGSYLNGMALEFLYNFLLEKDKNWYELCAFNIMPNHVHLLIKPKIPLTQLMQKLKVSSAIKINQTLNKQGTFWANNYYDKLIRDEKHFQTVYTYIKSNHLNLNEKDTVKRFYGVYE